MKSRILRKKERKHAFDQKKLGFKKKERIHAFDQEGKQNPDKENKTENKISTKKKKKVLRSSFFYNFPPLY